ncbi:MAG: FAD/NAD(P)-binding protein [Isosphaeraceae bacterium]|nr:FAD/NAD(P)-binding protein [Isosphaeraceae bacterium]
MRGRSQLLDLLRCWDDRPDALPYAELLQALKGLDVDRADLAGALSFDDRGYRRVAIWRRPHFEALVLCWKSGQTSPIHDHTGSSCAVRVIDGRATETRFAPSPCGRLIPRHTRVFATGAVLGCPGSGIHQMGNLEMAGSDLVTLHIYSPPPLRWQFYSLDQTTLAGHDHKIRNRPTTVVVDFAHALPPVPPGLKRTEEIAMDTFGTADTSTIAIVGGGFSGALVAAQLAALAETAPLRIALFEKGDRFARGLAYGTRCDHHLLNVPAGLMSALPDEPSHFLDWLRARDPDAQHGTFAPRRVYGDYLEDLLAQAARRPGVSIDMICDEVVDIKEDDSGGPVHLSTRSGRSVRAARVVLALGHQPPQEPLAWDGPVPAGAYAGDPWAPGVLEGLAEDDSVVLIGTGLSAIDLVVEACANGHRGTIHAISRHGLLPSPHAQSPVTPRPHFVVPGPGSAMTARGLFRRVRTEAALCEREGGNWRAVVDALRPVTQTLWGALGDRERQRFVRHVAPRWEVHRHRVAPAVDGVIQAAQREGRLVVTAGRVVGLKGQGEHVAVTFQRRGDERTESLVVRRVINCTGPARDIRNVPSAVLRSVLARGLGRPGPLALGLDVTETGALVDADGRPQTRVFAIGPLLKERLWESTAVRELRSQARELAQTLLADLRE